MNKIMGMEKSAKIYVAGYRGLVGSAIIRALTQKGYTNILTATRQQVDLTNQQVVTDFFAREKPEYVLKCAKPIINNMVQTIYV